MKSSALWKMLETTLPTSTVYYPVVVQLETQIQSVQRKELPMYRRWKTFLRIAEGRIQLMKDVESDGSACLKACDNMEVRLIPSFNRGRLI
jgi:hypothetical protein